ncbi:MAG: metallophosphoesterase [Coriobacteriales bacterium]|nr:metallophosphoesterase [Coriobacteriales bacterium]
MDENSRKGPTGVDEMSRRGFLAGAAALAAGGIAALVTPQRTSGVLDADASVSKAPVDTLLSGPKVPLCFHADGSFRVMVVSDLHATGGSLDTHVAERMDMLIHLERPDLVILGGDNVWRVKTLGEFEGCVRDIVAPLEERGIAWCHVFGNHDDWEGCPGKEEQQRFYESFDHCVSCAGPQDVPGVGNYILPIEAHNGDGPAFLLWALDSGGFLSYEARELFMARDSAYAGFEKSPYEPLKCEQVLWYMNASKTLEARFGRKIPGLMCFHIPLQECYNAWINREDVNWDGHKGEDISASEINSGMFNAILERGDIHAMVFGHDHMNDYMVEYAGVKLMASSTISHLGYWDESIAGVRVITLHEDGSCDARMSYLSGEQLWMDPGMSRLEDRTPGDMRDGD